MSLRKSPRAVDSAGRQASRNHDTARHPLAGVAGGQRRLAKLTWTRSVLATAGALSAPATMIAVFAAQQVPR